MQILFRFENVGRNVLCRMEYEKYKKLPYKWGFFWIAYYINFIKISYGAIHCSLQISYQAEAAWHMIKNSGRLRFANRPYKLDQTNHCRYE